MKNCYDDDGGWLMGDACSCIHVHMAKFLSGIVGSVVVAAAVQCAINDSAHNQDKLLLRLMMADPMSFLFFVLFYRRPNNNKITNYRAKESQ